MAPILQVTADANYFIEQLSTVPVRLSVFDELEKSTFPFSLAECEKLIHLLLTLCQNGEDRALYAIKTLHKLLSNSTTLFKKAVTGKDPSMFSIINWSFFLNHEDTLVQQAAYDLIYWLVSELRGEYIDLTFIPDMAVMLLAQEYLENICKTLQTQPPSSPSQDAIVVEDTYVAPVQPVQQQQAYFEEPSAPQQPLVFPSFDSSIPMVQSIPLQSTTTTTTSTQSSSSALASLPPAHSLPKELLSIAKTDVVAFAPNSKIIAWVDDNPKNNAKEIAHAKLFGVQVFQFNSTFAIKSWLMNHEELKDFGPDQFRIVSDRKRDEKNIRDDTISNDDKAGAAFYAYVRYKLGWNTPLLVYCGNSTTVKHLHSPPQKCFVSTYADHCKKFVSMAPLPDK